MLLSAYHLQFATLPWLALIYVPICCHLHLFQRNEAQMGGWQAAMLLFLVKGFPGLLTQRCGAGPVLSLSRLAYSSWWALWCSLEALREEPN